jgi:phage-related protein
VASLTAEIEQEVDRRRHQDGSIWMAAGHALVEKIEPNLWEVRIRLPDGIARVLFTVDDGLMVLLHGFIKKSRRIPLNELGVTRARLMQYRGA